MIGRKKQQAEQPRAERRQVSRGREASPAFSYYSSSRRPETPRPSRQPEINRSENKAATTPKRFKRVRLPGQFSFWLLVVLTAVCLLKVLWLSTNPKVVVLGKTAVTDTYQQSTDVYAAAARQLLRSSLTSHSKLTVNLNGTAAALEKQFPELQTVSLDVPLVSSRPIVYVQLAQPSLILQTPQGNYALSASGIVLAQVQTIPAGIPLSVDQSGSKPAVGTHALPGSTVSFIHTAAYQLTAAQLSISAFVLPQNAPYELDVRLTGKPYSVRYNLQADALTQSGAVIATIQQLGPVNPALYIDVRTPDRVYYK